MRDIKSLNVDIFADGADLESIIAWRDNPLIKGFTTNPTLMKKAGVGNYLTFAEKAVDVAGELPISFEVLSDDFDEMYSQGKKIAALGKNTVIKIPITNTKGEFSGQVIENLIKDGVTVNATALLSLTQLEMLTPHIPDSHDSCVSIFAGRIADAGVDPKPVMAEAVSQLADKKRCKLIWASPRQLYNLFDAEDVGCDIITMTYSLLNKIPLIGKDLQEFSLETVQMFYDDAQKAGLKIDS